VSTSKATSQPGNSSQTNPVRHGGRRLGRNQPVHILSASAMQPTGGRAGVAGLTNIKGEKRKKKGGKSSRRRAERGGTRKSTDKIVMREGR